MNVVVTLLGIAQPEQWMARPQPSELREWTQSNTLPKDGPRSPIIVFSDEIEHWVRTKMTRVNGVDSLVANIIAYKATKRKTQKLLDELETASKEFERKFDALRNQVLRGRKSPAISLWQFPDKKD